jgi:hypothetical protein
VGTTPANGRDPVEATTDQAELTATSPAPTSRLRTSRTHDTCGAAVLMAAQTRLLPLLDEREATELVFNRPAPAFLTCPWQESPEGNESVLVQPCLIVTRGDRQAKRRAIEANHDLLFWHQALESERWRLRLLPGLLLPDEGLLWALTAR